MSHSIELDRINAELRRLLGTLVHEAVRDHALPSVSVSDVVTESFTIEAINSSTRVVTLKDKDGNLEELFCGPEVQRFDALKVGDKVTFRYHESVVSSLRRPGQAARPAESRPCTRRWRCIPG